MTHFKLFKIKKIWTAIGSTLVIASIAQPIVSSQLANISPDELLKPMTAMTGNQPMPDEVKRLFAGVFANIEFSLLFAAIKLILGISILAAARKIPYQKWSFKVLKGASVIGILAFFGIGVFFVYSSYTISAAMNINMFASLAIAVVGLVFAIVPASWLYKNFASINNLKISFQK
ncbi:KxYKxGKxW signal peptide domain-containing protein [uncultured Croceitalea sp.]|uniref:KxYKxGKxW signal peptide domain-containing protein n=1 Tax=uncultured Croceitalea sp. TaxID=1798908 RepID=UPI003305AEE0